MPLYKLTRVLTLELKSARVARLVMVGKMKIERERDKKGTNRKRTRVKDIKAGREERRAGCTD